MQLFLKGINFSLGALQNRSAQFAHVIHNLPTQI